MHLVLKFGLFLTFDNCSLKKLIYHHYIPILVYIHVQLYIIIYILKASNTCTEHFNTNKTYNFPLTLSSTPYVIQKKQISSIQMDRSFKVQ